MFNSKVEQAYQQQSLISDFVLTPDGVEAILIKNNHLLETILETNSSSERNDSDIESIYEPWDVENDALEAIFNCQLSGSQAIRIREIHEIRRANIEDNNTELELAPLNDIFNSEMDTSSSSANSILHGTETSASLEFLYDEAKFDHFLSTCIEKFDLLTQFTANGVCGFFMVITRFIYGLYRLNFFFLCARKVKIKRLMKW